MPSAIDQFIKSVKRGAMVHFTALRNLLLIPYWSSEILFDNLSIIHSISFSLVPRSNIVAGTLSIREKFGLESNLLFKSDPIVLKKVLNTSQFGLRSLSLRLADTSRLSLRLADTLIQYTKEPMFCSQSNYYSFNFSIK